MTSITYKKLWYRLIDNKLKYEGIIKQFSWNYPTDFADFIDILNYSEKTKSTAKS